MTSLPDEHPHRRIYGTDGELIDLFMTLINRSPGDYAQWWYDYGALVGVRIGVALPPDVSRAEAMGALRTAMERIVAAGLEEAFLVRALKTDLDASLDSMGDTGGYDAKIEELRQHLQRVIEDPVVRASWRRSRAEREPEWLTKSDEDVIADARAGYDSFGRKMTTADGAAERWAAVTAWRAAASELLPDAIYDHWSHLNINQASCR
jgi:hypothetical protein